LLVFLIGGILLCAYTELRDNQKSVEEAWTKLGNNRNLNLVTYLQLSTASNLPLKKGVDKFLTHLSGIQKLYSQAPQVHFSLFFCENGLCLHFCIGKFTQSVIFWVGLII